MDQVITYTNENGILAIVVPTKEAQEKLTLEQIAKMSVPNGVAYDVVPIDDLPKDRTFRDAWEKKGAAIEHNHVKVVEIAHKKRREKRQEEMSPLDVEATIPALAASAEAKRATIRAKYAEMQNEIDTAKTVEEIKAALERKK